ncbi:type II secretion system minor pseudopilin GspJ [Rhizobium sp. CRIBSB]|nr:type II secretion system minor pseudopilin GspJ [Rhizobium sp. CRIBSB]
MVSLLIFGVIASAGVALLTVSVDNRETVHAATQRLAALQRTRALLKADLGQAVDRPGRNSSGARTPDGLSGGAGAVLVSLTRTGWSNPSQQPRASMQRVDYVLNGRRLERRAYGFLDGARPGSPQILLDDVIQARIVFVADGIERPVWPASDQRRMPDAVRVDLVLEGYGEVSQWFLTDAGR